MATYLIGAVQSPAHQPALTKPTYALAFIALVQAVKAAFGKANAARHVYDGLVGFKMPKDEAARRTYEMLYTAREAR